MCRLECPSSPSQPWLMLADVGCWTASFSDLWQHLSSVSDRSELQKALIYDVMLFIATFLEESVQNIT